MLTDEGVYPRCSRVDVVVTTPGRLVEHLRARSFASLRSGPLVASHGASVTRVCVSTIHSHTQVSEVSGG